MATSKCGPAPVCARDLCSDPDCEACESNRPQDCIHPYRPGKTKVMRVKGKTRSYQVTVKSAA